jgi:cytochrome c oxidase subunit 6b
MLWNDANGGPLQFWLAYRSLCPSGWYERWDAQRGTPLTPPMILRENDTDVQTEAGNFPARLDQ